MAERRKVTQVEFDRIECNRCGACCTKLWLPGPLQLAEYLSARESQVDPSPQWVEENERFIRWLSALEPTGKVKPAFGGDDYTHQYACSRFQHLEDGTGFCTAYDDRPNACRGFPYGQPVRGEDFKDCSWNVEIVQESSIRRGLRRAASSLSRQLGAARPRAAAPASTPPQRGAASPSR